MPDCGSHGSAISRVSTYNETVANYRETMLTAFQQVEDNLVTLKILSTEIRQKTLPCNPRSEISL